MLILNFNLCKNLTRADWISVHCISGTICFAGLKVTFTLSTIVYYIHHHQERTPVWGMAVRMSPLQAVRSCARCQAEKRPMLAGFRSASTVRVHVCAGLPLRLLQSRGWP